MIDSTTPHTHAVAVVIEDDPQVRTLLTEVLESAGFTVVATSDGFDGVATVRDHGPVIVTVDVTLPGIDGFEVVRRIRRESNAHIILVTALSDEVDAVMGLNAGADDYIVKPFRVREFRARVDAAMRRTRTAPLTELPASDHAPLKTDDAETLRHLDLRVDLGTRSVHVGDTPVELTRTEFELLTTLLESQRRVRDKTDLALTLRGESASSISFVGDADRRAVEAHITNLRRKIGDDATAPRYIETVRGIGYRVAVDPTRQSR